MGDMAGCIVLVTDDVHHNLLIHLSRNPQSSQMQMQLISSQASHPKCIIALNRGCSKDLFNLLPQPTQLGVIH